jgi:hypothetical protein
MSCDRESYNIVVIGAMNPRIHVPAWYLHYGLLGASEYELAISAPSMVVTPQLSQFPFKDISILCLPDRWEIKTTKWSDLDRMRRITERVFDELLMHTPVGMIGFNFIYRRETGAANVARHLASRLAEIRLGLKEVIPDSGEFTTRWASGDCVHSVTVGPSSDTDAPSVVSIAINYEYRFVKEGQFKLQETAFSDYSSHLKEAEEQAGRIVEAINARN